MTAHTNYRLAVALGTCSLGAVLVARSPKGLAAVLIGDDADALRLDLARRFPDAELADGAAADEGELLALVRDVVRCVEHPGEKLDAPLDLRGTVFQRSVWGALREIPAGATASYTEVAARLGRPEAARAVAAACAANPLAVVVPCHRVLARDGGLSGYRWGVARKRALLERERALAQSALAAAAE